MSNASRPNAADETFLRRAHALALTSGLQAEPNPRVGAVIEKDGVVLGEGFHVYANEAHAEVVALRQAGDSARGATLHVSLEPCSSHGRTPPCTQAILDAGILRVVCSLPDSDPRHRGEGFRLLRDAGVEVSVAEATAEAVELNEAFHARASRARPLVTVKTAASLDGRIAAASGASQWITGDAARSRVHALRRDHSAVVCGVGTVLADDPLLTARSEGALPGRPLRCVLDPSLRTPLGRKLMSVVAGAEGVGPLLIATSADMMESEKAVALRDAGVELLGLERAAQHPKELDLSSFLECLASQHDVLSLLVEGGGITAGRFLREGLVDRVEMHLAPLLLGGAGTAASFAGFGATALDDGVRLEAMTGFDLGGDWIFSARVEGGFDASKLAAELAQLEGE